MLWCVDRIREDIQADHFVWLEEECNALKIGVHHYGEQIAELEAGRDKWKGRAFGCGYIESEEKKW